MDYYIRKHLSIQDSLRLIAKEIVVEAGSECRSELLSNQDIIHSVRKKCKRIRALLRIVRPSIGPTYRKENIFFRDIARKLSLTRDGDAAVESLEKLIKHTKKTSLKSLIKYLIEKISKENSEKNVKQLIHEFDNEISTSIIRIEKWEVEADGFDAIAGGLQKTYRRGRRAMKNAFGKPNDENFHEWRKRIKYHYYQLELLIPLWTNIIKSYASEGKKLSEILGEYHDLAILVNLLKKNYEESDDLNSLYDLISLRKQKLQDAAFLLGNKIYAEKTSDMSLRYENLWNAWQNENSSNPL